MLQNNRFTQSSKENKQVYTYPSDYTEFDNNVVDACLTSNPYQNIQVFENSKPGRKFSYNNESPSQLGNPG